MDTTGLSPHLVRECAKDARTWLTTVPAGSPLPLGPYPEMCFVLELLIPEILRREHPEWEDESLDGFFFSTATRTDEDSLELAGTCILISDQTVTPFALELSLSPSGDLDRFRIQLGEPGRGQLGISGPASNSLEAEAMLLSISDRLAEIAWTYELSL